MRSPHCHLGRLATILALVAIMLPFLADTGVRAADDQVDALIANADGDRVRLRAEPSVDADVVALLDEGSALTVSASPELADDGSAWYAATAGEDSGFVAAEFVTVGITPSAIDGLVATTSDTVNLRSGPSLGDAVLEKLPAGEMVEITGDVTDGWMPVRYNDQDGFIVAEFLTEGTARISAKAGSSTRYVLESVRLRSGPGTDYRTLDVLPVGFQMELTGDVDNGYAKVTSGRGTGWVAAQYIAPWKPDGSSSGGGGSSSGGSAYTNDRVSLRTGPGTDYRRVTVLNAGTNLSLTGETSGGFSKVSSTAGKGWVATAYISTVAPQYTGGTRYTIDSVNLRRGPGSSNGVIKVVPSNTEIRFTGTVVNNYGKVATTWGDGWISIDYFRKTRPNGGGSSTPNPGTGSSNRSLVNWPVKGGQWYVSQGYNGSSHQNTSKYWQYYYAFDIKKSSGSTAWQPVYAPVDGRVRWIDESTGGLSIYMGNGLAFAMFHMYLDDGIKEGMTLKQGQYMGVIAPAGEKNSGASAHLHITGWYTSDEGNWSRAAQPFVGRFAIEGVTFPATGKKNDYLGYEFNP